MRAFAWFSSSVTRQLLRALPTLAVVLISVAAPVAAQRAPAEKPFAEAMQFAPGRVGASQAGSARSARPSTNAAWLTRSATSPGAIHRTGDVSLTGMPGSHTNHSSFDVHAEASGFTATSWYFWYALRDDWEEHEDEVFTEGSEADLTLNLLPGRNEVIAIAHYYHEEWFGGFLVVDEDWRYSDPLVIWYDDSTKTYGASVSPHTLSATHVMSLPGSAYTQFQVTNTGTADQDMQVAITACTGVLSSCAFTVGGGTTKTQSLLYGTAPTFGVSYQIGSAGTGTVKFKATSNGGPAFADSGIVTVTAIASGGGGGPIQINMHDPNPGVSISRAACVSTAIERRSAVECGDLRIVRPLPATTTMNIEHNPALTYLSRHETPGAVLAADVTMDSTITGANQLLLIMKIPGKDTVSAVAPWDTAWNDGQARRVALPFNAAAKSVTTGVYAYTMEVWALNNGVPVYSLPLAGDTLVVVDRTTTPFGRGWWLEGLEQLSTNTLSATTKLWIGGDGSTRLYTRQSDTTVWTVTPTLDRPDTLRRVDSSGTTLWRRSIGNRAYVQFDNAGRHVATVNELGYKTRFVQSATTLDSIVLPVPSGSSAVVAYRFTYVTVSGVAVLDSVYAPETPSSGHRVLRPMHNSSRNITGFHGTDMADTGIESGYVTFGTGNLVTSFWPAGLGQTTLCPVEGTSICSPTVLSGDASTVVNGPRTDVADTTRIWHTRYGAPRQVRDALGNTTVIYRENATFPLLVTKVVAPSGYTKRTTYTSRALPDSAIDVDPYGSGQNAVTRFAWDSALNRVTQITGPTGAISSFAYDTLGLMTYTEDGRGSSTRTNYAYDASRRLEYVQPPGHTTGQRYHLEYDSYLGNASKTTTPLGFVTETIRDTVGRPFKLITPIDSNPGSSVKALRTFAYNAWSCTLATSDKVYSAGHEPTYAFASISGTATNGDLSTTQSCSGPDVTTWYFSTITLEPTQNPYGREACAGVTCVYDDAGHITQSTTSAGSVYFKYDALNRLAERRTGAVTDHVYAFPGAPGYSDPLAFGTDFPALGTKFPYYPTAGDTLKVPADTAVYSYDADGNMLTANNHDAQVSRSYYPNGAIKTDTLRIRSYTNNDFTTNVYGITYAYDLAGRRDSVQIPTNLGAGCTTGSTSQCFQHYHYVNDLSALDTVTSHLGHKFAFTYDDKGRQTGATAPGGVDVAWAYDLEDRLVRRQERRNAGAETVHLDSLWYNPRTKVDSAKLGGTADLFQVARFAYDHLGYLGAAEFVRTTSPADTTNKVYAMGVMGNADALEIDKNLGSTWRSYTWDSDGRLIGGSLGDTLYYAMDFSANAGPIVLESALRWHAVSGETVTTREGYESASWYQTDGKLRYFQRVGEDTLAGTRFVFEEYRYDALGRRVLVRSRARSGCTTSFCKSAVERYVWDGDQVLFEMRVPGDSALSSAALDTDTSTVSAHYGRIGYIHAGGIDAPLALYRNGVALVPHANWRGFYDAGTDTAGAAVTATVTWHAHESDPFLDDPMPNTVNGWSGSLLAAGQDNSGLMYRRNRYYDPTTAHFTQTDPTGLDGGINLYGYANGDPINFQDPLGLSPRSCIAAGGAAVAAAAAALRFNQLAKAARGIGSVVGTAVRWLGGQAGGAYGRAVAGYVAEVGGLASEATAGVWVATGVAGLAGGYALGCAVFG